TGANFAIAPTSAANLVKFSFTAYVNASTGAAGTNSIIEVLVVRGATTLGTIDCGFSTAGGSVGASNCPFASGGVDAPFTTSATTYKLRQRQAGSATSNVTTSSINCIGEEI